jgi:uncharacterized iron-regulated protein
MNTAMTVKPAVALLLSTAYLGAAWSEPRILDLAIGDPGRRSLQVAVQLDAIVDTRTTDILSPQALLQRLDESRLILVAENHTSLDHHRVQLRLLELLQEAGRPLVIGLEMFPASDQGVLDAWTAGSLSEPEFVEQADWYGGWGYDWDYYRDLFLFARAHAVPMVALNASRELVADVRTHGLTAVRQRRDVELPPAVTPASDDYRTLISNFFETDDPVHGALPEEQFNALLEAQSIWDAIMAYAVANTLTAYPEHTLVVLAGTGHVVYELGIARQLEQWFEGPVTTIVPVEVDEASSNVQASLGDFIWGIPAATDPAFPSLEIVTTTGNAGLTIFHVEPESAADLAGMQAGDVLTSLRGQPMSDRREFNRTIATLEWGDEVTAVILRDETELTLTVHLRR